MEAFANIVLLVIAMFVYAGFTAAGGVVCGRRGAKDRHTRRSSRMAARLAPRCVASR